MAAGTAKPVVGLIGGTGLDHVLRDRTDAREINFETPFGAPSSVILTTSWCGVDVALLARHGPGHRLIPSSVPYRANIFALKELGVTHILASGACGSLREEFKPADLVVADQVIDKTFKRDSTFFDCGIAAHVEFSDPFCPQLRRRLTEAGAAAGLAVHPRGTYVCMEGPQFSTRAESRMHRAWGGDLIGMTCMPEAKLAREAEIPYALVGLVTDYDCWRPHDDSLGPQELLTEIIGHLKAASERAMALLEQTLKGIHEAPLQDSPIERALGLAIWSQRDAVSPSAVERLAPIVGKYLNQ